MAKKAKIKTVYIFRYLNDNGIETWGFICPEEKKVSTVIIDLVRPQEKRIQKSIINYNLCFNPNKLPLKIYGQYQEIKPLKIKDQEWLWRLAAEARAEKLTGPIYIFQAGEKNTILVLIIWHQEEGELFSDILDGGWMVMGFDGATISIKTLLKKKEVIFTPPSDLPPGYINPQPLGKEYQPLLLQYQEQLLLNSTHTL